MRNRLRVVHCAKDDEWFTEHVVVKGDLGRNPGLRAARDRARHDRAAAHDPNSTVYYRNIRIEPLK